MAAWACNYHFPPAGAPRPRRSMPRCFPCLLTPIKRPSPAPPPHRPPPSSQPAFPRTSSIRRHRTSSAPLREPPLPPPRTPHLHPTSTRLEGTPRRAWPAQSSAGVSRGPVRRRVARRIRARARAAAAPPAGAGPPRRVRRSARCRGARAGSRGPRSHARAAQGQRGLLAVCGRRCWSTRRGARLQGVRVPCAHASRRRRPAVAPPPPRRAARRAPPPTHRGPRRRGPRAGPRAWPALPPRPSRRGGSAVGRCGASSHGHGPKPVGRDRLWQGGQGLSSSPRRPDRRGSCDTHVAFLCRWSAGSGIPRLPRAALNRCTTPRAGC